MIYRAFVSVVVICAPIALAFGQGALDHQRQDAAIPKQGGGAVSQPEAEAESIDIVVVGRRPRGNGTSPKIPPRCVRRPGDPADLVRVGTSKTSQRVIAPDRKGMLALRSDTEQVLGPTVWSRAGTGVGQYVFRVPDDGSPMCIGAAVDNPDGWGQLRQIVQTTRGMRGRYVHFSMLVAARDAKLIRFWVAVAGRAEMVGGDTHTAPLHGTFGWLQADVIVGPVLPSSDHISYGFLLWGKGDVWVLDPHIELKTRDEVREIPALPVTLKRPPGEQSHPLY